MAREVGAIKRYWGNSKEGFAFENDDQLERFAVLVAAHEKKFWMGQIEVECNEAVLAEREACAKVADEELMNTNMLTSYPPKSSAAWNIAAAIRARSENGTA